MADWGPTPEYFPALEHALEQAVNDCAEAEPQPTHGEGAILFVAEHMRQQVQPSATQQVQPPRTPRENQNVRAAQHATSNAAAARVQAEHAAETAKKEAADTENVLADWTCAGWCSSNGALGDIIAKFLMAPVADATATTQSSERLNLSFLRKLGAMSKEDGTEAVQALLLADGFVRQISAALWEVNPRFGRRTLLPIAISPARSLKIALITSWHCHVAGRARAGRHRRGERSRATGHV